MTTNRTLAVLILVTTAWGHALSASESTRESDTIADDRAAAVSAAMGEVENIVRAVRHYAAEDAICCGDDTADLTNWFQMRGFVSGSLRDKAIEGGESATLAGANPWGGDYKLVIDERSPYSFGLRITGIEPDAMSSLASSLDEFGNEARSAPSAGTIDVTFRLFRQADWENRRSQTDEETTSQGD